MPRLRADVKETRRHEILDAAVRSLTRHGYAGTSMRTIAEEAGLTKGGLYAYFASKEALLLAVAEQYFERQVQDLEAARGAPAAERLRAFLARFAAPEREPRVAETQRAILDLWSMAGAVPEVRAALETRYERYRETVAGIIRAGQQEGRFRGDLDAGDVAAILLAARDGLVFHRVKLGLPLAVGRLTERLAEMVVEYLEDPRGRSA